MRECRAALAILTVAGVITLIVIASVKMNNIYEAEMRLIRDDVRLLRAQVNSVVPEEYQLRCLACHYLRRR